jgi:hypothetical protein
MWRSLDSGAPRMRRNTIRLCIWPEYFSCLRMQLLLTSLLQMQTARGLSNQGMLVKFMSQLQPTLLPMDGRRRLMLRTMMRRGTLFSMLLPAISVGSWPNSKSSVRQARTKPPIQPAHRLRLPPQCSKRRIFFRDSALIAASFARQAAMRDRQFSTLTSGGQGGASDQKLPNPVCPCPLPIL